MLCVQSSLDCSKGSDGDMDDDYDEENEDRLEGDNTMPLPVTT